MISDYENICVIDSFKNNVRTKKIQICSKYLTKKNILSQENTKKLFSNIFLDAKNTDSLEALLCLRCRVSYPIKNAIGTLYKKNRSIYEIDYLDMMTYVLDDYGENFLKVSNDSNKNIKIIEKAFKWSNVIKVEKNKLRPFGARVLLDFNSELSNIDTWTFHKVRSNSELKSYLKSFGLNLKGTWSLISEQSPSRVREAWRLYGELPINTREIESLHKSYVQNYKKAKTEYRKYKNTMMGWEPDLEFLQSLKPKQKDTVILEKIGKAIRKLISVNQGSSQNSIRFENMSREEVIKNELYTSDLIFDSDSIDNEKDILQTTIKEATFSVVKNIVDNQYLELEENDTRRLAWKLYAEGFSQRDIATRCDHKQAWVSKLIKEKIILERISLLAVTKLKDYPEFKILKREPEKIDNLIMQLQIYLISKQPDYHNSILKEVLKEVINK